jgi:hypothetical protein
MSFFKNGEQEGIRSCLGGGIDTSGRGKIQGKGVGG